MLVIVAVFVTRSRGESDDGDEDTDVESAKGLQKSGSKNKRAQPSKGNVLMSPEVEPYRLPLTRPLVDPRALPAVTHMQVAPFTPQNFMTLPTQATAIDEVPFPYEDIHHLNRYRNIMPNDRTRVRLAVVGKDPTTEYINANFVTGASGDPNTYIATQGPKPETAYDFWRMVWEQRTHVIIMTTGLVEGNVNKCHQYWPSENDENGTRREG